MSLKLLTLRDHLLEDLSSCSSNGFKSFPRRKSCTTTVRFLLEIDLAKSKTSEKKQLFLRSRASKTAAYATTTVSALQRASAALVNAVRHLPFSSVKPPSPSGQNRAGKGILPRSFSKKLLKRRFWRKSDRRYGSETGQWRLFREVLDAHHQPSYRISDSSSIASNSRDSSDTRIKSIGGGNVSDNGVYDAVEIGKDSEESKVTGEGVGARDGDDSVTDNCSSAENGKEWSSEEKEEQFSPISVLDSPFEDEQGFSSPSHYILACIKGSKQKLLQKVQRFKRGTGDQIEPVDLNKRMGSMSELENESHKSCSASRNDIFLGNLKENIHRENNKDGNLLKEKEENWVEKSGRWRNLDEERENVAEEMETDLLTFLIDEMLIDLVC